MKNKRGHHELGLAPYTLIASASAYIAFHAKRLYEKIHDTLFTKKPQNKTI